MGQAPAPHEVSDKCVVPEHDRRLSPVQRMRKSCHVRVCFLEGLTLVRRAVMPSPAPSAPHLRRSMSSVNEVLLTESPRELVSSRTLPQSVTSGTSCCDTLCSGLLATQVQNSYF